MELPTQVKDTGGETNIIQHTKPKIWQNTKIQQGSYSRGPPLFPGVVTNNTVHAKQSYECDENDNVNCDTSQQEAMKGERSSCMYEGAHQSGVPTQKTFLENYLWHKPVTSEPSANDLSDLTKDFIDSVINGVKLEEALSTSSKTVKQPASVRCINMSGKMWNIKSL